MTKGCDECGANGGYALYCVACAEKYVKPEWVGLTDDERRELWWNTDMSGMPEHDYGKAIEAKLKEKNGY